MVNVLINVRHMHVVNTISRDYRRTYGMWDVGRGMGWEMGDGRKRAR